MASVADARVCFIDAFLRSVEDTTHETTCIQTHESIHFYPQLLSKEFIKTAGDDQLRCMSSVIADSAGPSNEKLKLINSHLGIETKHECASEHDAIRYLCRLRRKRNQVHTAAFLNHLQCHILNQQIRKSAPTNKNKTRSTVKSAMEELEHVSELLLDGFINNDDDGNTFTHRDALKYLRSLNVAQFNQCHSK